MSNSLEDKPNALSSPIPFNLQGSHQISGERSSPDPSSTNKLGQNVSQRPSRKAKNRDAIQKHLNRDVDLLMEEEPKKKPSTKKAQIPHQGSVSPSPQQLQSNTAIGKRSSTKSHGGKSSINKQEIQVPPSIVKSSEGKLLKASMPPNERDSSYDSNLSNFAEPNVIDKKANMNSNRSKKNGPAQGKHSITTDKSAASGRTAAKNKRANSKSEALESAGTVSKTKTSAKSSVKKENIQHLPNFSPEDAKQKRQTRTKDEDLTPRGEEDDESDANVDSQDNSDGEEDAEDDVDSLDDQDQDEEDSDSDASDNQKQLRLDKNMERKRLRAETAANRAMRIMMGKSGAQAASRRSIKKGKDACQRKLWNKCEDDAIVRLVAQYGTKRWTFIAQQLTDVHKIGGRTGKQCRERWHNHLDPNIKKTPINNEEERIIFDAHKIYGNKWADIAKLLNTRTSYRSDNCIKNYYYSTLRKHIRRINKSLKQCQVAKKLNMKVKTLTADILFPLVKDNPKKFEDLEHTMRMIFNHEDGQQVTQRGIIAAAQNRLKVEKQLEEMRQREREEAGSQAFDDPDSEDQQMDDEEEEEEEEASDNEGPSQASKSQKITGKRGRPVQNKRQQKLKKQKVEEGSESEEEGDEESNDYKSQSSQEQEGDVSDQEKEEIDNSQKTSTINRASESKDNQFSLKKRNNKVLQKNQNSQGSIAQGLGLSGSYGQLNASNKLNQFPKTLQVKPPISKNSVKVSANNNAQKSSIADNLKIGQLASSLTGPQAIHQKQAQGTNQRVPDISSASNPFKQNMNDPISSYKKSKKEVTINNNDDYVTKDDQGNRSNCSDTEQLQFEHKKDKKHKKKKKKKSHKSEKERNKSKHHIHHQGLFGGLGLSNASVDELAAQFDYMDSNARFQQNMNMMDVLRLANQKDSASKIYPGFGYMHGKGGMKDQLMSYPHGPHTCFPNSSQQPQSQANGPNQNYMPPYFPPGYMGQYPHYLYGFGPQGPMNQSGMMYHPGQPVYPGAPTPIAKKMQQMSAASKNTLSFNPQDSQNLKLFKGQISQSSISGQFNPSMLHKNTKLTKQYSHKDKQESQRNSDEKKDNSQDKKKFQEGDAKEKEQKSGKESEMHPYMAMHQEALFAGGMHPMQLQAYYQKNGHMPPPPFGMAPHPGMHPYFMQGMHMHGNPQQWQRERHAHDTQHPQQHRGHSQSYQNQFVMPVTPMGLKQVFGPEKLISQLNCATSDNGGTMFARRIRGDSGNTLANMVNLQSKNKDKAEDIGSQSQQDGREKKNLQKDLSKPLALSLHRRASSTDNLRSARNLQPTQFNNNITLMINHFGNANAPNEQKSAEGEQGSKGEAKKEESGDKEKKENGEKEMKLLQNLSANKQKSTQKGEANKLSDMLDRNESGISFNQQIKKHQKISQLKDMLIKQVIKSNAATPNNQNTWNQITGFPPMSTSNYLMFAQGSNKPIPHNLNQQAAQKSSTHNVFLDQAPNIPLQTNRLVQATPKIYNGTKRIPQNTTPKGSSYMNQAEQANQHANTASKGNNLHSGHTFNAGIASLGGSRLGTKTNAQLTAAKKERGSTLITPKVSTIEQDPDAHRKMLEKMFQNTDASIIDKIETQNNLVQTGGAFTAKKKQSGENSNSKTDKQAEGQEDIKVPGPRIHQSSENQIGGERDSLGFFYANPHALNMNIEPMASIYTGAPEGKGSSNNPTPLLGKNQASSTGPKDVIQDNKVDLSSPDRPIIQVDDVDRVDTILENSDNEGELTDAKKNQGDVEMDNQDKS